MHGAAIAALGGAFGPAAGLAEILLHAQLAVLIELGEIELSRRVAEVGGFAHGGDAGRVLGLDLRLGVGEQRRTVDRRGGRLGRRGGDSDCDLGPALGRGVGLGAVHNPGAGNGAGLHDALRGLATALGAFAQGVEHRAGAEHRADAGNDQRLLHGVAGRLARLALAEAEQRAAGFRLAIERLQLVGLFGFDLLALGLLVVGLGGARGGAGLFDHLTGRQRTGGLGIGFGGFSLGVGGGGRIDPGLGGLGIVGRLGLGDDSAGREAVGGREVFIGEARRQGLRGREGGGFETGRREARRAEAGRGEGLFRDRFPARRPAEERIVREGRRRLRGLDRRRRGRGGGHRRRAVFDDLALGDREAGIDALAGFLEQARRALLALADAFGQVGGGALAALTDAFGDTSHLLADIVDGQGVAALGIGDALGQPLGDAGDLAAQFFEGLGLDVVGAADARFHGRGDAGHFAADLFDDLGAAGFRRLHAAAQRIGHAHHLAAHALDGLGGSLFSCGHVGGHFSKTAVDAVEATLSGFAQLLGHLDPRGFHAAAEVGGQFLEPAFGGAAGLLHRAQAAVEGAERGAERLDGVGGA